MDLGWREIGNEVVKAATFCAVFSLEPLTQDLSNEIMDLRGVNLFTPLPLPCSALLGGLKSVRLVNTLVWSSGQLTWSKLRLGLVAKFGFGVFSGAAKGFRAGCVRVKLCCW